MRAILRNGMIFIDRKDIRPLFGTDWLRKFNRTIQSNEQAANGTDQSEKGKQFETMEDFRTSSDHTKNLSQISVGTGTPANEKGLTTTVHLQKHVETEARKFVSTGHSAKKRRKLPRIFGHYNREKGQQSKNCTGVKKNKWQLSWNETFSPKMIGFSRKKSTQIPKVQQESSKINRDYPNGQLKLTKKNNSTRQLCFICRKKERALQSQTTDLQIIRHQGYVSIIKSTNI